MDQAASTPTRKTARHYEIAVSSSPRQVPKQQLGAIVKAFAAASEKNEAVWRQSEASFEITRVRFNKAATRAIVLIRFSDKNAPIATAHLLINLNPADERAGLYRAVLEEAPGITHALLGYAMEALARRLFSFYAMGPRGQFVQAHPRLHLSASTDVAEFTLARASALCEAEIRPDVSLKLDKLLKQRVALKAAA